jgi:conjugal transfer pilus assembly protein TraV
MKRVAIGIVPLALLQAGCSSLSGLSGSSSYACKAPEGVTCDSVSGTYANAMQNNLPSQQGRAIDRALPTRDRQTPSKQGAASNRATATNAPATIGLPPTPIELRSAPRVLRLWFKPWEDADNDLYDQGYVYVQVDPGRWQIEHVQRQVRETYAPLKPPPRAAGAGDATSGATSGARPPPRQNPPSASAPLVPQLPRSASGDDRPAGPRAPAASDDDTE